MHPKIISYNCESFCKNVNIIRVLLGKCDVLLLQETLLTENSDVSMEECSDEFDVCITPATRRRDCFIGKSSGGLAIFYKKSLSTHIRPKYYTSRIMGITINVSNNVILLLNVYFPCDYRTDDSLVAYLDTLSELGNIYKSSVAENIIMAGDFNCDPNKGRFFKEFSKFVNDFSLNAADIRSLPEDTHTYVSRNNNCSTSWLDHLVVTNTNLVSSISVMYGDTFEDHIPLQFALSLSIESSQNYIP